jgi:hypothetical protein
MCRMSELYGEGGSSVGMGSVPSAHGLGIINATAARLSLAGSAPGMSGSLSGYI